MSKLDGQMQTEAINLEGCSDDELRDIRSDFTTHTDVARMCGLLLTARVERVSGRIANAIRHENAFDRLYATLPNHLKW